MITPATTVAPEPSVALITAVPLDMTDRCDRCGAQAFVRITVLAEDGSFQDLLFCGHHFATYEHLLRGRVTVTDIQDEREKLKPSS